MKIREFVAIENKVLNLFPKLEFGIQKIGIYFKIKNGIKLLGT